MGSARRLRRAVESLESRVLLSTTVFSDDFESAFLTGWTNTTASGANASTRWGLNDVRASGGVQSAFASALAGGVTSASGYQNNQNNSLVREHVSLTGFKVATLTFDYFLNTEGGYDTFSVAVVDNSTGSRTTVFTESGNYAAAGFRGKSLDLSAFAGKSDVNVEFNFTSDSSVSQDGGGVWIDNATLTGDATVPPGTISGKLFNDANGNKVQDTGEGPLAYWNLYLDQNRNGQLDSGEKVTKADVNGNYSFTNLAPGTYYVAEQMVAGYQQTSPGTSGASAGSAFKIDVQFPDNTLTAAEKTAFTDAANRWAQIIVGDVPDVSESGGVIDDLQITASAPTIDGRGGVLGQAAPTGFRAGSTLPYKGFMQFDSDDLAQLQADGQLTRVILHEMGHVLGFGTIWDSKGLLTGGGTGDPHFTGPAATAQYDAIFGTSDSSVPVEGGGGSGTADSHWRESTFGNELMTGYLNGGANPLSAITVGEMADIGYTVSYSAADAYTKPASLVAGTTSTSSSSGGVSLMGPYVKAPKDESFYGSMENQPVEINASNTASVVVGSGTGGTTDTTILPNAWTVYVDSGTTRTNVNFGDRKFNAAPTITSVADSPDPVTSGGSVTLTASGVGDSDGTVSAVNFYRESNGTSGLQTGTDGDTLVGTDTTTADGTKTTFSTSGMASGAYTYYAQVTDNGGAKSGVVSCTNNVSASSVASGGSISGTVFNDTNGNGVKDTGEPGLANWKVYLDQNNNKIFDTGEKTITTGSSGTYTFSSLGAGTYNVREVDQTNWNRTASSPIVTLTAGQKATGKDFPDFLNASIAGRVYVDANSNGSQDTGEGVLAGVRVYDDKNGNGVYDSGERTTTTDSAGNYTLSGLVAGTRTVRIVVPSGKKLISPSVGYYKITPTSGQVITSKKFGVK